MLNTCGLPPSGSDTSPGDVQENGIWVGCVAQGSAGLIDVIGADPMLSLSEIVTGALWSMGPGLKSVMVKLHSPPG